jgi:hypothetical protein
VSKILLVGPRRVSGGSPTTVTVQAGGHDNDTFTGDTGADSFNGGPDTATDYSATEGDSMTNMP